MLSVRVPVIAAADAEDVGDEEDEEEEEERDDDGIGEPSHGRTRAAVRHLRWTENEHEAHLNPCLPTGVYTNPPQSRQNVGDENHVSTNLWDVGGRTVAPVVVDAVDVAAEVITAVGSVIPCTLR